MLMVFTRATVMYVVVMITMRLMGKRMIGQLQPFELAIAMLMADLAAAPLSDIGIPLLYGVVPMLALLLAHSVITVLSYRFGWMRRLVSGRPAVVIRDGKVDHDELVRQCYSLGDLMESLRVSGRWIFRRSAKPYSKPTASCRHSPTPIIARPTRMR